MSIGKKALLGIIITIGGFFVLVAIAGFTTTDEDRARWEAERELNERWEENKPSQINFNEQWDQSLKEPLQEEDYYIDPVLKDLGIDPREFEGVIPELKPDYNTLDKLQQGWWDGKISQNELCGGIITLMNQNSERYSSEFWTSAFLRDCSNYQP